jgi:hypothetical protein
MDNLNIKKRQIYKDKNPTSILNHERRLPRGKRNHTIREKKQENQSLNHLQFTFNKYIGYSPKIELKRSQKNINIFREDNKNSDNIISKNLLESPYSNLNLNASLLKGYVSPLIHSRNYIESPIKEIKQSQEIHKKENNKELENKINVKKIFYNLTYSLYFSLYLLCLKILFNFPMPNIPNLGTSLFIISFNNVVLSILFIIIDQIDYLEYLNFKKIIDHFFKMIINTISILLTIKSLQKINLINFILLINLKPIILSFYNAIKNNMTYKSMDTLCYFLFCFILISEFMLENKVSIIFVFILIMLNTSESIFKLDRIKAFHSYFLILGSSILGISISPIIMVLNRDILIISFSQYLLYLIISLAYFFNLYFLSKYNKYSFGLKFKIFSLIFFYSLFFIYSNSLLKEDNYSLTYIFFFVSFFINNYAYFRNKSITL